MPAHELGDEMKEQVRAAALAGVETTRILSDESDAGLVEEFRSTGVTVTEPDIVAFQTASEPIRAQIAEQDRAAAQSQNDRRPPPQPARLVR